MEPVDGSPGLPRSVVCMAIAAVCAFAMLGSASFKTTEAQALARWYECTLAPNTWCRLTERHSYSTVSSGQYDWWTDTSTDYGWWCSKLWNEDNNRDYGRVCDFARWVTANVAPPSDHMHAMSANGDNCCRQRIRGYTRTP